MESKVELHYKNLSESYDKKINVYCQQRFVDILRKFLKGKILEIGCGTGYIQDKIKQKTVGIDITFEMLKKNKNLVACSDAKFLPFKYNTFDLVYSINLIEHVDDPLMVIKECKRVLKKNGTIILITPNGDMEFALDAAEKLNLKLPEGPHKFLKFKDLKRLFNETGLQILSTQKFVLLPKEIGPISRISERLERILPHFCFFICIIGSKK